MQINSIYQEKQAKLIVAIQEKDIEKVKNYVRYLSNKYINGKSIFGYSPLSIAANYAIYYDEPQILNVLIKNGGNIKTLDKNQKALAERYMEF